MSVFERKTKNEAQNEGHHNPGLNLKNCPKKFLTTNKF